jgi:hypothetical protein
MVINMEIDIKKVTILLQNGQLDSITFDTNLPCPYSDKTLGNMALTFKTSPNMAIDYMKENFPNIKCKVIDAKVTPVKVTYF